MYPFPTRKTIFYIVILTTTKPTSISRESTLTVLNTTRFTLIVRDKARRLAP